MQISEALDRIGKRLFVDGWIFGFDAVAEGAVGNGGEFEIYRGLLL